MINILREIDENATMKDMIINLINNIEFYLEHRDKLADIHLTTEYLNQYLKELYEAIDKYEAKDIPLWFDSIKPYRFLSGNFPYCYPFMKWNFSFKEILELMLYEKDVNTLIADKVEINGIILTADEWRDLQNK